MKPHFTNTGNPVDFPKMDNNVMNERIRELAQQTDIWCDQNYFGDEHYGLHWEEKFAGLIIRECMEQVRDEVQYEYDWKLADAVTKRVMEHFGIEK